MVLPGWWCPAAKKQTHTSYKTQQHSEPQTVSEGRGCGPAINDSIRRGSNNDSRQSQSANNLSWRSERWARNTMPGNWLGKYNFPGIVPPPPPPLPPPYTLVIYCHLRDTYTHTYTLLYTLMGLTSLRLGLMSGLFWPFILWYSPQALHR